MKKISLIVALILSLASLNAKAAFSCAGTITQILDWDAQCITTDVNGNSSSHLAYRHSGVNGGTTWVCSNSDSTDALVMMAYANKRDVYSVMNGSTCATPHYETPRYFVIRPF